MIPNNLKEKFISFWRRFKLFLFVVGPGVITAVADNDAGGVAAYPVGAALYEMNS